MNVCIHACTHSNMHVLTQNNVECTYCILCVYNPLVSL